jgi:HPt (histidine-containing phosphotransfer) domain-containing protein
MGAVDFGYLEGFAAGDRTVVREVLELFLEQAKLWDEGLAAARDDGWRDLAHSIKGTARGIGARALGDAAEAAERDGPARAGELRGRLTDTTTEVRAYLAG